MNRQSFLLAVPALIVAPELILPKRTYFLPPRGGWSLDPTIWAVRTEGGYYFSNSLVELLRDRQLDQYTIFAPKDVPDMAKRYLNKYGTALWSADRELLESWDKIAMPPAYSPVIGTLSRGGDEFMPTRIEMAGHPDVA